jgi:hypothetical protein
MVCKEIKKCNSMVIITGVAIERNKKKQVKGDTHNV